MISTKLCHCLRDPGGSSASNVNIMIILDQPKFFSPYFAHFTTIYCICVFFFKQKFSFCTFLKFPLMYRSYYFLNICFLHIFVNASFENLKCEPAWPLILPVIPPRSHNHFSHRSHRWHALFYKAQLSPPPTAESKESREPKDLEGNARSFYRRVLMLTT